MRRRFANKFVEAWYVFRNFITRQPIHDMSLVSQRNDVNPGPTLPDAACQPENLFHIHQNRHLHILQDVIDFRLDINANGSGEIETPIVAPTAQSNAGDHSRSGYCSLWVNDLSSSSAIGGL